MDEFEQKYLVEYFLNNIYKRGLFAEADESDKKVLTSEEGGIRINTLWMCGVIMITVRKGNEGNEDYRQITFAAHTDMPYGTLYLRSFEGEYIELLNMLDKASKRFSMDGEKKVMKSGCVVYAGVKIGECQRQ